MHTKVTEILDQNGISYVLKPHSMKVYTAEDAARERGVKIGQVVKCMIVKSPSDDFILALVPGDKKLDLKKFARLLGLKKLSMASFEEVKKETGYPVGAVSPLGLRNRVIKTYMDDSVKKEEFIDISSGRADMGIELRSDDLVQLLQPKIVNIAMDAPA